MDVHNLRGCNLFCKNIGHNLSIWDSREQMLAKIGKTDSSPRLPKKKKILYCVRSRCGGHLNSAVSMFGFAYNK